MSTVLLVRHGLTALTGSVLAGHTPGVHLDERGTAQAAAVAERIAVLPLAPSSAAHSNAASTRRSSSRPRSPAPPNSSWRSG